MSEHAGEIGAAEWVDGWRMLQDDEWPERVSEAMSAIAFSAADLNAGSAQSVAIGHDDRPIEINSVCFVGDDVLGHWVVCKTGETLWGTRSKVSLNGGRSS